MRRSANKIIQLECRRFAQTKPFASIPEPRGSLPYIGTGWHYKLGILPPPGDLLQARLEFYQKYGPVVKERIHGGTTVHLYNLDDMEAVYKMDGKKPAISPLADTVRIYRTKRGYGLGVGNINGDEWYRVRFAANKFLMIPNIVKQFFEMEASVAEDFIENLLKLRNPQTKSVDDLSHQISMWNLETAGYNTFGRRFHSFSETSPMHETACKVLESNRHTFENSTKMVFPWLPLHRWFATPLWRQFVKNEDYFNGLFHQWLDEAATAEDKSHQMLLQYLRQCSDLNQQEVNSIALNLFTDGLTTTVPTMQSFLYCLATNPEKQILLREEIFSRIGNKNAPFTSDMLQNMPYLRACLRETLRVLPSGLDVSRIIPRDGVFSGYEVPKKTNVLLNTAVLLQDPQYFTEPTTFIPERWLRDERAFRKDTIHPFLLVPFSHGPRMCMGRRFAEQEMLLLTIKLLQRFNLVWVGSKEPMKQKWRLLNTLSRKLEIAFIDLDESSS